MNTIYRGLETHQKLGRKIQFCPTGADECGDQIRAGIRGMALGSLGTSNG
jgi:hypothetical protein